MKAALEYSDKGCMLYSLDCPGAFARGQSREDAAAKLPADVEAFCRWEGWTVPEGSVEIVEEKHQLDMKVEDADSDMMFTCERQPLAAEEYTILRELVLKSARDLDRLYASISNPDAPLGSPRATFYGEYPNTARKMFEHPDRVTSYYVGELGAEVDNLPGCYENRLNGLMAVEALSSFPALPVIKGSYGEEWSLRKVLRRFLWHDRIHARAMYRRAKAAWGSAVADPFRFDG